MNRIKTQIFFPQISQKISGQQNTLNIALCSLSMDIFNIKTCPGQKFYITQIRMSDSLIQKKYTKCPFTAEEDEILKQLVSCCNHKEIDWNHIAIQMNNRNARQCKDRWEGYLDSNINKDVFTNEENYFILKKVEEIGKKWKVISSMMERRTDVAVKSQYRKLIRHHISIDNVFRTSPESYMIKKKCPDPINHKIIDISRPKTPETNKIRGNLDETILSDCFNSFFAVENEVIDPFTKPDDAIRFIQ